MTQSTAILIEDVWKTFRIFQNKNTTLKQALTRRRGEVYEDFWALRGVSFDIPEGTTYGLIGANGAGKSTMLKVLARILVPDKGRVLIGGRISALLELGAGFHPELTGRENIFLNGNILGMSKSFIDRKLEEIIEFSGLENFIDQPVKTYSSGMYARLGFSVAVAVEPDILLVDEVLAVGDEQFQRRCAERMSELRSGGRTVVIVSHGLAQIQQLCDQVTWIDHGTVKSSGATEDVVNDYLASVTTAYRLDTQGRERSGNGEIQLEAELLCDGPIVTGAPATLRLHWSTSKRIKGAVFHFNVRPADGYILTAASTTFDSRWDDLGPGEGYLDYQIPSLPLLPGAFHIGAAIVDRDSGTIYDRAPSIVEFDVSANSNFQAEGGAASMQGRWTAGEPAS